MPHPIDPDLFLATMTEFLEETFKTHHGIFLDKGTSLFETLAGLSAEQASRTMGTGGATVAAHVAHVDVYLGVLEAVLQGRNPGPVDWRAIWNSVDAVTPETWAALQEQLRATYQRVLVGLREVEDWTWERPWPWSSTPRPTWAPSARGYASSGRHEATSRTSLRWLCRHHSSGASQAPHRTARPGPGSPVSWRSRCRHSNGSGASAGG